MTLTLSVGKKYRNASGKIVTITDPIPESETLAHAAGYAFMDSSGRYYTFSGDHNDSYLVLVAEHIDSSMSKDQKDFCIQIATSLYRDGFTDWLNGMDDPKEHQGASYYTGFKQAKKMHPNR